MTLEKERWIQLAEANAAAIRLEIDKLKERLAEPRSIQYSDFWAHTREIVSLFKTFKPMVADEREALWTDFRETAESCRKIQAGSRARNKKASRELRERIETILTAASSSLRQAEDLPGLDSATALLNEAMALMKGNAGKPEAPCPESGGGDGDGVERLPKQVLLREDRDECWSQWIDLKEEVKARRRALRRSVVLAFQEKAKALLESAREDDPKEAKERIKTFQQEVKASPLTPYQRENVRKVLREAWTQASDRLDKLKEEKKEKRQEWVARMGEHVGRWEVALLKNRRISTRIKKEIAELEERKGTAESAGKAERIAGWIEEKTSRLSDFAATRSELEEKIRSVRAKLGKEAPEPVTKLPEEEIPPPAKAKRRRPRKSPASNFGAKQTAPAPPPGLNLGEVLAASLGKKGGENGSPGATLEDLLSSKEDGATNAG